MASEKEIRQRKGTVEMFIDVHNMTNNLKGEIGEFISRSEMRRQVIHKNDHCSMHILLHMLKKEELMVIAYYNIDKTALTKIWKKKEKVWFIVLLTSYRLDMSLPVLEAKSHKIIIEPGYKDWNSDKTVSLPHVQVKPCSHNRALGTCSYKSISFLSGNLRGWMAWSTVSQCPLFISPMKLSTLSTVLRVMPVSSCAKVNTYVVYIKKVGNKVHDVCMYIQLV